VVADFPGREEKDVALALVVSRRLKVIHKNWPQVLGYGYLGPFS
jgi:hypothetical protein